MELFTVLWKDKVMIVMCTLFAALCSIFIVLSLPDMYRSESKLVATDGYQSGGLSQLAGQFGGLASLAGVNLGGGESQKDVVAIELLQSWSFFEKFIEKYDYRDEIFASKSWDRKTKLIVYDEQVYSAESGVWVGNFDTLSGSQASPSSWDLYKAFMKQLDVSKNKQTGFISISIEHVSPIAARDMVQDLILFINEYLREQDNAEATENLEFLKTSVNETHLSEMKDVIYQLIQEQTRALMLANNQNGYVFKVIEEAKVAEEKIGPLRALICIILTFVGGAIGVLVSIIKFIYRQAV
jgi:uncharacterized protein involved in exopolysaccharide biosynthesis